MAEKVWLNTASGIYHCVGSANYGKTAAGKYMSEAEASKLGNRGAGDFICGPTKVWVNTGSNVYHCPGSANYGKTSIRKYMTEPEARKAKARPANDRVCAP